MPLGVIVNSTCVAAGGLAGAVLGKKLKRELCASLTLVFGVCSMTLGVNSITKMQQLPPVILAVVLGTLLGELLRLEFWISRAAVSVQRPLQKFYREGMGEHAEEFMTEFISIVVLFCASGTGIFGALQSGISGDHSVLLAKAVLDLFTAAIFAARLGYLVVLVAVPQFLILIALFFGAALIMPLTNAVMLADFTACGGILMLATGFRIAGIRSFPIANMIPAMALVMPFSWIWGLWM